MQQKSGFGGVDPLESLVAEWCAGWREEMEGVLGVEGVGEISRKYFLDIKKEKEIFQGKVVFLSGKGKER